MAGYIDLKKLNIDELVGVVNLYPWFAGARKELCVRMKRMEGEALSIFQIAESAMYMPSRKILSDLVRTGGRIVDADVEVEKEEHEKIVEIPKKRVYAGAGDYFSQDDYDAVRQEGDNVFSRYASEAARKHREENDEAPMFDIFTETLAQIYAEQGYYEQAKDIYSKLILAYPEKNAYFAALIQKLDELN